MIVSEQYEIIPLMKRLTYAMPHNSTLAMVTSVTHYPYFSICLNDK